MESLFVLRGHMQEVYAERSKVIDKVIQFILALTVFYLINKNIGFMKALDSPIIAVGLALICTFLPLVMTVVAASVFILFHAYSVSLGVLTVVALTFLVLYIFYFRLTFKMAFVLLITPIAFALKVPYLIPAAFALISAPSALVAIVSGTMVFYLMECMKKTAAAIETGGTKDLMTQITLFAKQVFQNKEMWVVLVAIIISFFVIYTIRRMSVDFAWKIAIVVGAVVNIVIIAVGDIALGIHTSYTTLIVGSVIAVLIGLVLELFVFSIDYARSELLQYEDDEYYYYVKAIPKISVATPEKTIKRINERQETEIIDTEEVRRRAGRTRGQLSTRSEEPRRKPTPQPSNAGTAARRATTPKRGPVPKEQIMSNTEQILLRESLKRDLESDRS